MREGINEQTSTSQNKQDRSQDGPIQIEQENSGHQGQHYTCTHRTAGASIEISSLPADPPSSSKRTQRWNKDKECPLICERDDIQVLHEEDHSQQDQNDTQDPFTAAALQAALPPFLVPVRVIILRYIVVHFILPFSF
jgi:hypothetical protein